MATLPVGVPVHLHGHLPVGIGWRQPHYAELIQTLPALDFLEVHSENFFGDGGAALAVLQQGRAHYAISLHGVGLSLGSARGVDNDHVARLGALIARTDPVRVSDHASFARVTSTTSGMAATPAGSTIHASDLLPLPFTEEALCVLCSNVAHVQERLQRPLSIENLSAYLRWKTPPELTLDEPQFLMELTRRTGCTLLVDVNNIYVNARNASLRGALTDPVASCIAWLDQISPQVVAEIHLAGHSLFNDEHGSIVIDDHGSRVCDDVWKIYRHALQRFGPVPTLVEWDTHIGTLQTLLDEAQRARTEWSASCGEPHHA